jgi:cytochrome c554/c'-like protein
VRSFLTDSRGIPPLGPRRFLRLLPAAALFLEACRIGPTPGDLVGTVDLRQRTPGEVLVRWELPGAAGIPLTLESSLEPSQLRIASLSARQGGAVLAVRAEQDRRGFHLWSVTPSGDSSVVWEYSVRPGPPEEDPNSGPTGYRLGTLDSRFGLFSGRQIFLLPTDTASLRSVRLRFIPPQGCEVIVPWSRSGDDGGFRIDPWRMAPDLLDAVLALGRFDAASSPDGRFRVLAERSLPPDARKNALERALLLREDLRSRLGCHDAYTLILAPRTPEGMLVSVPPSRSGLGLSLGEGIPERWLAIGRSLARSCLGLDPSESVETPAGAGAPEGTGTPADRRFLEGLPLYFSVLHSDRAGWRSRQAWMEELYRDLAGDGVDLRKGERWTAGGPREIRAALALNRLSREMEWRGLPGVEAACGDALRGGSEEGVESCRKTLPPDLLKRLDGWLSSDSGEIPFPSSRKDDPIRRLPLPPGIPPAAPREARLDLYLGGRNLGLLEQCGCRSKQVGGFARRTTLLRERMHQGVASVALELGDAVPFDPASPPLDRQKEEESDLSFALLARSGESACVVGHSELAYGPDFLARRVERLPRGFRLLSMNVEVDGVKLPPALSLPRPAGSLRLYGAADPASYSLGRGVEFEDATASLGWRSPAAALHDLTAGGEDRKHAAVAGPLGPSAVLELQERFPEIPLILTDDSPSFKRDPRFAFQRPLEKQFATMGMLGGTLVVLVRSDSFALVRLGLLLDRSGGIVGAELEDLPLDETVKDDPEVRRLLDRHYETLAKESGLSEPPPVGTRLARRLEGEYVGDGACAACHTQEAARWRATPHASAFASILERRRQGVPLCVSCHVTGYGQPTGYRSIEDLSRRHVQCESCHGPGSRHLALPVKGTIVSVPQEEDCMECHDPRHSEMTHENFPEYWLRVLHAGRGGAP